MPNESDKPSVEGLMTLADAYVVAASGDTATARHKYSALRAELLAYAERLASAAAPAAPATPLREVLSDERIGDAVLVAAKSMLDSRLARTIPVGELIQFARALLAASSDEDRKLMEQARKALEKSRSGLIQMREHAQSYGEAWARAYVKEYQGLIPGSAEEQFQLLSVMHKRLADVADGIVSSYVVIAALRSRLDGEKT